MPSQGRTRRGMETCLACLISRRLRGAGPSQRRCRRFVFGKHEDFGVGRSPESAWRGRGLRPLQRSQASRFRLILHRDQWPGDAASGHAGLAGCARRIDQPGLLRGKCGRASTMRSTAGYGGCSGRTAFFSSGPGPPGMNDPGLADSFEFGQPQPDDRTVTVLLDDLFLVAPRRRVPAFGACPVRPNDPHARTCALLCLGRRGPIGR